MALYESWPEYVWSEGGEYFASPSRMGIPKKKISQSDYALKKLNGAEELWKAQYSTSTAAFTLYTQ